MPQAFPYYSRMGRSLGGDFEDDDVGLGAGTLDLGSGSIASHHPGGAASAYDGGGVDFDDPFAEDTPLGALELDLPSNSATAMRSKAPTAPAPPLQSHAPQAPGGMQVPELALPPPPAPRSSGMINAVAAPSSAPLPSAPPSSQRSTSGQVPAPSSSSGMMSGPPSSQPQPHTSGYAPASQASGYAPPASFAPAPSRPTAAAVIARYPIPPAEMWRSPRYAISVIFRQLELRTDLESLRRRRSPDVPLYEAALRAYDAKTFRIGMSINLAILAFAMLIFFMPVIIRFTRSY